MRTRAALLSILVVAALVLGACGSDTKTISKADYVRKGNQLCKKGTDEIRTLSRRAPDVPNGSLTKAQRTAIADYLDKGVNIQNDLIKQLRALGSPTGDTKTLEQIYKTSDSGAGKIQKAADAVRAGNLGTFRTQYTQGGETLDKAQKAIVAYGLSECGGS